ncbi:MAG: hypothetical protein HY275_02950 [Gemmatimonadetes bacterium]|nr:hypothetical protein [Gemmatimonadota bacterium]
MRHLQISIATVIAFQAIAWIPARAQAPAPAWTRSPIAPFERTFERARRIKDQIDVTVASGRDTSARGVPLATLRTDLAALADTMNGFPGRVISGRLAPTDRAAWHAMLAVIAHEFPGPLADASSGTPAARAARPVCTYDAAQLVADSGVRVLRARMKGCYRLAAEAVRVGDSTFNRLGALGRLGWVEDRARRQAIWLALDTVWRSVNGDNARTSAWRTMLATEARGWRAGARPVDRSARALGMTGAQVEQAMVALLEAWRRATPDSLIEPWDYWFQNGEASRRLAARIPRTRLLELNRAYYAALGADLAGMRAHYDIDPRPGQTPVAYTTFGDRPRWEQGAWVSAEPWIFATYADGGLDILNELLHESGHAVHIAAIRTRPAYADWPDSDVFTEGIADIVALDAYEPAWQQHWLGDSVPTAVSLRARYGGIMLDAAWSLFEIRMHRAPDADPNATWSEITSRYLHIRPHPERSWWAMRAQLFDLPGYMLNYAMGAIIVADVRAALVAKHGAWLAGDAGWYARASEALYRHGREVPARTLVERLLGRRPDARALTHDLARMRPRAPATGP